MVGSQYKSVIENLYEDTCTVYELESETDETTKITSGTSWNEVLVDKACRLSYKDINSSEQGDPENKITKVIKLFLSPDLTIKPGSKIKVTHKGVTSIFKNTGIPSVYSNHQEIMLETEMDKA